MRLRPQLSVQPEAYNRDGRDPFLARLAMVLFHPLRSLRRRINAWVAARVQRQPGPVSVPRHRVYIVPTRFGYGYGILLLVMLLGAMNYTNSMAFALTFLLAGLGLLGMHHTHGNLLNIRLHAGRVTPVFAGELAQFEVRVENPTPSARYTLMLGWPDEEPAATVDVPAGDSVSVLLPLPAPRRGWLPAPRFAVATEFPLGLLHAWTWIELDMNALVYPVPAPAGRQPPQAGGDYGFAASERPGVDEFVGLRGYAPGDMPRSIHWKSFAKLELPQVKRFGESVSRERVLDYQLLTDLGVEARLSQLCRWVLEAEQSREPYALRLPGLAIDAGLGATHREQCLRALALFQTA